jgi:hypothetical protein
VGGNGGTAFTIVDCPAGTVATGVRTRANVYLDLFGLGCGTPTPSP